MTGINPFILCNLAEQIRNQELADREKWQQDCIVLGASLAQLESYDQQAAAYAMTTPYDNGQVVRFCRRLAQQALLQGKPFPASPEQAIEDDNREKWALVCQAIRKTS